MTSGAATGQAYLKTGTLSDTRALAGYVRAKSGRVYAVSMIVTDPEAAKGTPALDCARRVGRARRLSARHRVSIGARPRRCDQSFIRTNSRSGTCRIALMIQRQNHGV